MATCVKGSQWQRSLALFQDVRLPVTVVGLGDGSYLGGTDRLRQPTMPLGGTARIRRVFAAREGFKVMAARYINNLQGLFFGQRCCFQP